MTQVDDAPADGDALPSDGRSTRSSPEPPPIPPGPALDLENPLTQLGAAGLMLVGAGLHNRLAPETADAWLVDQQDVQTIVGPLARIANRHAADVAGEVGPDTADALEVGVGVAGYVLKNAKPFREVGREPPPPVVATDDAGEPVYGPAGPAAP